MTSRAAIASGARPVNVCVGANVLVIPPLPCDPPCPRRAGLRPAPTPGANDLAHIAGRRCRGPDTSGRLPADNPCDRPPGDWLLGDWLLFWPKAFDPTEGHPTKKVPVPLRPPCDRPPGPSSAPAVADLPCRGGFQTRPHSQSPKPPGDHHSRRSPQALSPSKGLLVRSLLVCSLLSLSPLLPQASCLRPHALKLLLYL